MTDSIQLSFTHPRRSWEKILETMPHFYVDAKVANITFSLCADGEISIGFEGRDGFNEADIDIDTLQEVLEIARLHGAWYRAWYQAEFDKPYETQKERRSRVSN